MHRFCHNLVIYPDSEKRTMKILYPVRLTLMLATIILSCGTLFSGEHPVMDQLMSVNKTWGTQKNIPAAIYEPIPDGLTHRELIRVHLERTEKFLRSKDISHLTTQQASNRMTLLDELSVYSRSGAFPYNTQLPYQNPVFIDEYDNFCAVGHLIKISGHEDISRMIADRANLAYLGDMHFAELDAWVNWSGFEPAELALIQPSYQATYYSLTSPSDGLPGDVFTCQLTNNYTDKLYAGGNFNIYELPSSNIPRGIACYDFSLGQWNYMEGGVNGAVRAIEIDPVTNMVYVGGSFTSTGNGVVTGNVAAWNGQSWIPMGSLSGEVRALAMYNGVLYAAGDFYNFTSGNSFINLAKWNGNEWVSAGAAFNNTVYTLEVIDDQLYIGGAFTHCGLFPANRIVRMDAFGFHTVGNGVSAAVRDIVKYNNTVYVGGDFWFNQQTFALAHWDAIQSVWVQDISPTEFAFNTDWSGYFIADLEVVQNIFDSNMSDLLIGGNFHYNPSLSSPYGTGDNFIRLIGGSTVMPQNKLNGTLWTISAADEKDYCLGGEFTSADGQPFNHIALSNSNISLGIGDNNEMMQENVEVKIYPNPTSEELFIEYQSVSGGIEKISIFDAAGRKVYGLHSKGTTSQRISTLEMLPGTYLISIEDSKRNQIQRKLIVK